MVKKLRLLFFILVIGASYFFIEQNNWVSVARFHQLADENYLYAMLAFSAVYLLVACCNLPGSGPLAISAGFVFGFSSGVVLIVVLSGVGATLSMLAARTFLRSWAQRRLNTFLEKVNRGLATDGMTYLISLRLIPVMPFFVINPVMGLTHISVQRFYLATLIGMLPLTMIYVYLGDSVGAIEELNMRSLLSAELIFTLCLVSILPLVIKRVLQTLGLAMKFDPIMEDSG